MLNLVPADFADPQADYLTVRAMLGPFHGHPVPAHVAVTETMLGGVRAAWYDGKNETSGDRVAFHCHGGAFVSCPLDAYHFYGAVLVEQLGFVLSCRTIAWHRNIRTTPRRRIRGAGPAAPEFGAPMTIGVIVVDDQALVRGALCVLVDSARDLVVLGEASNGAEAIELVEATRPDVVLMDVRMPAMDGIEATRRILSGTHESGPRILILTTFDLDEYVYAALRAGASGFMLKGTPPDD
jgi:CheY-like chemotaxis protein